MEKRFLLAGILVIALVATGSMRLLQISGSATKNEVSQEVQIVIDDGSKTYTQWVTLNAKETAFDSLKHTATSQKAVEYKYVSGHAFITAINGVMQDKDHSWIYLVNGKIPEVMCDQYYPTAGDVITFRYAANGLAPIF